MSDDDELLTDGLRVCGAEWCAMDIGAEAGLGAMGVVEDFLGCEDRARVTEAAEEAEVLFG